jgi:hypothetical protein
MATIGKKVIGKRGRFEGGGPITYPVGTAVLAGQVVTGGTSGTAGKLVPAGANAQPAGVATTSGIPTGAAQQGTDPWGRPIFYTDIYDSDVAVARHGAFYLAATGTIAFLDFVKCGANGSVVKWDPSTDQANTKVGQCVDTDGATSGAAVLVEINIS